MKILLHGLVMFVIQHVNLVKIKDHINVQAVMKEDG